MNPRWPLVLGLLVLLPASSRAAPQPIDPKTAAKTSVTAPKARGGAPGTDLAPDLGELLQAEVEGTTTGSFGYRLQRYGVKPYLHGYVTFDFYKQQGSPATFDLHYFNLFVGANILDLVVPEIQLEHEYGGEQMAIRYAQLDVNVVKELLTARGGLFLVPFGHFNELLYPEFLTKLADRPHALREIVPVSWAEVGLQLRGRWRFGEDRFVGYAAYVVNGLEQRDDAATPGVDRGGGIREMRRNYRDQHHGDKAFGARFFVQPLADLRIGASFYRGAYTPDGASALTMVGGDFHLGLGGFTLNAEYVFAHQQQDGPALRKHGGYVLFAYRFFERIEPVLAIDGIKLDGAPELDRLRFTGGINVIPLPKRVYKLIVKTSYAVTLNRGAEVDDDRFIVQVSLGF